ncbi:MAG: hypothetical protein ACRDCC_08495 [Culicoidibacterales bacterium]
MSVVIAKKVKKRKLKQEWELLLGCGLLLFVASMMFRACCTLYLFLF